MFNSDRDQVWSRLLVWQLRFRLFQSRQDALRRQRQWMNADAECVGHSVADGGAGCDYRRLAEADHAALPLAFGVVEIDDEFANVTKPAKLIIRQIGIYKRAGRRIVDPLLEQRVGDAHDNRAVDLAL